MNNTSDTPVLFKILQDSTKTFSAFPHTGMIPGKSFSLVTFEFNPKVARHYNFSSQLIFNNNTANIQSVNLKGYCYAPQLSFQQDKLFFPPTFVGVSARRKFFVKNDARVPMVYEFSVPEKYKNEVRFNPNTAHLSPNEEAFIYATFTPLKKKEYLVSVPMHCKNLFDLHKHTIGFFNPGSGMKLGALNDASSGIMKIRKDI